MMKELVVVSRISGSHGGVYEDGCLLGCSGTLPSRSLPAFQRYLAASIITALALMVEAASTSETSDYTALQPRRQPSSWS
jgi:hypothetical protein